MSPTAASISSPSDAATGTTTWAASPSSEEIGARDAGGVHGLDAAELLGVAGDRPASVLAGQAAVALEHHRSSGATRSPVNLA